MDELTKSYIVAWDSIRNGDYSDKMKAMYLSSMTASVSDWQNEIWFVAQQLWEDYINERSESSR